MCSARHYRRTRNGWCGRRCWCGCYQCQVLSEVQIQKKIGEKIKATRLKQNITQDSLAESASISCSSVQKVESGEIKSFDTFLRILRTLGMLDELHHQCKEEELNPSEYYDLVNSIKKNRRKRAR